MEQDEIYNRGKKEVQYVLTLSIGIITRNRNDDLIRCVESIENSIEYGLSKDIKFTIGKLVISNDGSKVTLLKTKYIWEIVEGPKKGIGANRNNIIDNMMGDFSLITDDDMEFPLDFIIKSLENLQGLNGNVVLTGKSKEDDNEYLAPSEPDFWGYRRIPIEYSPRPAGFADPVTWFPVECFSTCRFDESVIYGPTEMDFAYQLLYYGYEIIYSPELWASHWGKNRSSVAPNHAQMEFSRIYYTLRRYYIWDRSVVKFLLFRIFEWPRLTIALLKIVGVKGILIAARAFIDANVSFESGKDTHNNIKDPRNQLERVLNG